MNNMNSMNGINNTMNYVNTTNNINGKDNMNYNSDLKEYVFFKYFIIRINNNYKLIDNSEQKTSLEIIQEHSEVYPDDNYDIDIQPINNKFYDILSLIMYKLVDKDTMFFKVKNITFYTLIDRLSTIFNTYHSITSNSYKKIKMEYHKYDWDSYIKNPENNVNQFMDTYKSIDSNDNKTGYYVYYNSFFKNGTVINTKITKKYFPELTLVHQVLFFKCDNNMIRDSYADLCFIVDNKVYLTAFDLKRELDYYNSNLYHINSYNIRENLFNCLEFVDDYEERVSLDSMIIKLIDIMDLRILDEHIHILENIIIRIIRLYFPDSNITYKKGKISWQRIRFKCNYLNNNLNNYGINDINDIKSNNNCVNTTNKTEFDSEFDISQDDLNLDFDISNISNQSDNNCNDDESFFTDSNNPFKNCDDDSVFNNYKTDFNIDEINKCMDDFIMHSESEYTSVNKNIFNSDKLIDESKELSSSLYTIDNNINNEYENENENNSYDEYKNNNLKDDTQSVTSEDDIIIDIENDIYDCSITVNDRDDEDKLHNIYIERNEDQNENEIANEYEKFKEELKNAVISFNKRNIYKKLNIQLSDFTEHNKKNILNSQPSNLQQQVELLIQQDKTNVNRNISEEYEFVDSYPSKLKLERH